MNQSLNSEIFPSKLKIAKIIPIYKKDYVHLAENYRPISLFTAIFKVFEKKFLASYIAILYKTIIYLKANMDFTNFSLLDMPY